MSERIQILIVEDVAEDIILLERALRKDGISFDSRCVDSKQKLIETLHEFVPDIVISDYALGQFSGLDVINLSKAKYPTVPVIIVTGTLNDVKAANTIKAGADDYILKDRQARVGPAVRSVLEKREELEEKIRYQKLLEKKEAQLRSLFERMLNGFAIHEMVYDDAGKAVDFVYLDVNDAYENIVGLKKSNIVGRRATEIFPNLEHISANWIDLYDSVISTGQDCSIEQYFEPLHKWLYISAYKTGDKQFATILDDITKRKSAEKSLHHRVEMETLTSSISTIFISNLHRDIHVGVNATLEKAGEAMGVDRSYVLLLSEDGSRIHYAYEWCAKDIEPQIERFNMLTAQEYPWGMAQLQKFEPIIINHIDAMPIEASAETKLLEAQDIKSLVLVPMVHNGILIGCMGYDAVRNERAWVEADIAFLKLISEILSNAIEHKKTEDNLRESEKRFSLAFNASPVLMGIIKYDDGTFLAINDCFSATTGYKHTEVIGKSLDELKLFVDPNYLAKIKNMLLDIRKNVKGFELEIRAKSGEIHSALVSVELLTLGDELYILCVLTDITERKQIENMLIQSDKMAAIGTLTAGIAHELNNPLGYIMGNLDIVLQYSATLNAYHAAVAQILDKITDARFQSVIDEVQSLNEKHKISYILRELEAAVKESKEGAVKASRIVRDLNAFARMEKPMVKPADINQCIDKVINIVWNELKYKAELNRFYGNIPAVECDVNKIEQVLVNLLVNAAHAIPDKGEISIQTLQDNTNVIIRVSDTGTGISKDIIGKIFDAFFTTKEPGKGTGLGLSISYRIITDHNGTITVESEEGKGTTFIISLPIKQTSSGLQK